MCLLDLLVEKEVRLAIHSQLSCWLLCNPSEGPIHRFLHHKLYSVPWLSFVFPSFWQTVPIWWVVLVWEAIVSTNLREDILVFHEGDLMLQQGVE
jgi:hypothetical protein